MTYDNVPDDWHTLYRVCEYCGTEYHMSEGCECLEESQEVLKEELVLRMYSCISIDSTKKPIARHNIRDSVGSRITKGEEYRTIEIGYNDGEEKYTFTIDNWEEIQARLQQRSEKAMRGELYKTTPKQTH